MKFEKFLKQTGVYGEIVDCGEYGQFLKSGRVMMRIPDGVNILSAYKRKAKQFERAVFAVAKEYKYSAALTAATLPTPDAKASQIERVFSDNHNGEISISNNMFALIERTDSVHIVNEDFDEDSEPAALAITNGCGESESIVGVIFDAEYYEEHEQED